MKFSGVVAGLEVDLYADAGHDARVLVNERVGVHRDHSQSVGSESDSSARMSFLEVHKLMTRRRKAECGHTGDTPKEEPPNDGGSHTRGPGDTPHTRPDVLRAKMHPPRGMAMMAH